MYELGAERTNSAPQTPPLSIGQVRGHKRVRNTAVSLQVGRDMLGGLLMALKDFQARLQQVLQRIACRRDQLRLERNVDGLVVGDLVFDVGLVESGPRELIELGEPLVPASRARGWCRCPRV